MAKKIKIKPKEQIPNTSQHHQIDAYDYTQLPEGMRMIAGFNLLIENREPLDEYARYLIEN